MQHSAKILKDLLIKEPPQRILMIKAHSMGIGDILRSSAAWRVMKNQWPECELHLLFLSRHEGYPSEVLISNHHLLHSATFLKIREGTPDLKSTKKISNFKIFKQIKEISNSIKPDLIIDFEWSGLRTSLITWIATKISGGKSIGIAQFPLRSVFYNFTAFSERDFRRKYKLSKSYDYTLRDFVVLDAIDLERNQTPIEINCDANFRDEFPFKNNIKRIGINIGCGTPGAESKRMSTTELAEYVTELNKFCDFEIFLTGADYEHEINEAFIEKLHASQKNITVYNLAGKTDIKKLLYLINSCDLFITTDSGPYHISVALMRPTLCWLTYNAIGSIHNHLWVRCLIAPNQSTFVKNSLELIFKKNSF